MTQLLNKFPAWFREHPHLPNLCKTNNSLDCYRKNSLLALLNRISITVATQKSLMGLSFWKQMQEEKKVWLSNCPQKPYSKSFFLVQLKCVWLCEFFFFAIAKYNQFKLLLKNVWQQLLFLCWGENARNPPHARPQNELAMHVHMCMCTLALKNSRMHEYVRTRARVVFSDSSRCVIR